MYCFGNTKNKIEKHVTSTHYVHRPMQEGWNLLATCKTLETGGEGGRLDREFSTRRKSISDMNPSVFILCCHYRETAYWTALSTTIQVGCLLDSEPLLDPTPVLATEK